ncbi:GNAT family N-acetyltransferase [Ornithinibacillus contaminans]|uniref:GNAT family N-acetyltransferase n=1 Tax=Ornithinibacillus contaminans TaxID=694055 RepID=UPI00064D7B52|nr:GNAT family N-acetyltransferase [Ornithinibacillus contaminans]
MPEVELKRITRDNWEDALALKVAKSQESFVPTPAVSLAKVYIKPDGENVEYIPFGIYDDDKMVGFIMHAYVEETNDMYWINGFLIDASYQGKGYGKAALGEMITWIKNQFGQCQIIHLTVFQQNQVAKTLYERHGFVPTGQVFAGEDVMKLTV